MCVRIHCQSLLYCLLVFPSFLARVRCSTVIRRMARKVRSSCRGNLEILDGRHGDLAGHAYEYVVNERTLQVHDVFLLRKISVLCRHDIQVFQKNDRIPIMTPQHNYPSPSRRSWQCAAASLTANPIYAMFYHNSPTMPVDGPGKGHNKAQNLCDPQRCGVPFPCRFPTDGVYYRPNR